MSYPVRLLFALDRLIASIEKYLLSIMLMVMLFLSFLQVILRDFFNSGIGWSDLLVRYMVLWIGFMGASLATKDNRHLRIDFLHKVLPKKMVPVVELFVCLGSMVVGSFLFYAAYQYVCSEKVAGISLFGGAIPEWTLLVIMPIGLGMITFRYLVKLIELLYKFGGRKSQLDKILKDPGELDISLNIKIS